eukprot:11510450-Alexandrium_andersonii.AAC.1
MSASLVGSEMCIRDRCASLTTWIETGSKEDAGTEQGKRNWDADAAGAQAVSYTHLTLPTICSV